MSEYVDDSLVKRRRPLASDKASVASSLTVEQNEELLLPTAHGSPHRKKTLFSICHACTATNKIQYTGAKNLDTYWMVSKSQHSENKTKSHHEQFKEINFLISLIDVMLCLTVFTTHSLS